MLDKVKDILDPPLSNHKLVYIHIAKCGGSSIVDSIVGSFKPWRANRYSKVFMLHENSARFTEDNAMYNGSTIRADLLNYAISLPYVECVAGHFLYSHAAFLANSEKWHFITMLRNPVDRWFSDYFYNKGTGDKFSIDIPFEEYIKTDRAAASGRLYMNTMTLDIQDKNITFDEKIEITISRLKQFSIVGILEDTGQFKEQFKRNFAYELKIDHLNKTKTNQKSEKENIIEKYYSQVETLCETDIQIYNAFK